MQPSIVQFRNWQSSKNIIISQEQKHQFAFEEEFPVKLNCTRFNVDFSLVPNFHDYFEIAYLYSGAAGVIVEGVEYPLSEGDMVVIGNNILHTYTPSNNHPADVVWVAFLPTAIYAPGESEIDFEYVRPFYEQQHNFLIPGANLDPRIPDLLFQMHQLTNEKGPHYRTRTKTCMYQLLNELLIYYDKFEVYEKVDYGKHKQDLERIKRVLDLVSEHFSDHLSLEQAAEAACMSKHYFCRFFKKVTGYTFLEYLMRFRVDKAKELILEDRLAVTEIAYEVGFDNLSYFYRVFKRFTHNNPREFLYHRSTNSA